MNDRGKSVKQKQSIKKVKKSVDDNQTSDQSSDDFNSEENDEDEDESDEDQGFGNDDAFKSKKGEREFFKVTFMAAMLNVPHFMLNHLKRLNPDDLYRRAKIVEELSFN